MTDMRSIIHVDMDAFYAAIEIRDRPELEGLPVVVGGSPEQRGVIAAASYAAREYGVHSAMPSKTAVRLCPQLIFLKARHSYYAQISKQIRHIFERYTPLIEPLALDEAFLDVTLSQRLWGRAEGIGQRIKCDLIAELQLTASVGIAPNKFMAKLASDLQKPDGFVVVTPDNMQSVLDPLPVKKIWGVGKAGEKQLHALGIRTVAELRQVSVETLECRFGQWGGQIWRLANGQDERKVIPDGEAKSISHETTFSRDIIEQDILTAVLLDLTEQVAMRLRRHQRFAQTVQIKIRFSDFHTLTRARTLHTHTNISQEIWQTAQSLLVSVRKERAEPVRLLGIGVTGLLDIAYEQADLFEQERNKQRDLDHVADQINARFGSRTLHRGAKK